MSATQPTPTPKELTQEEIDYQRALARLTLQRYNESRAAEAPAADVNWQYGATGVITVVGGYLRFTMQPYAGIGKNPTVQFEYRGQGGAVAPLAGGATWGTFWCNIDHAQLAGDATFSIEATPFHTSAQFFRNGEFIGHYIGGGINIINVTAGGGTGTFTI
jgi:hypothetical protein